MTDTNSNKRKRRMAREPKTEEALTPLSNVTGEAAALEQAAASTPKEPGKIGRVLALLRQPGGATLDQMVEATGWLPHTTRAALTGLTKKGHTIERSREDGVSRYSAAEAAPE